MEIQKINTKKVFKVNVWHHWIWILQICWILSLLWPKNWKILFKNNYYLPWMRWCKAVLPCTSWTSISQPVWRRCKFTVSTTMESLFNQSEHVEHWDKRLVTFVKSSGFSDGEVSLREIPPSRQNSNKGLEEVKPAIESNGNFIKKVFQLEFHTGRINIRLSFVIFRKEVIFPFLDLHEPATFGYQTVIS